jgi:hypothetical protein
MHTPRRAVPTTRHTWPPLFPNLALAGTMRWSVQAKTSLRGRVSPLTKRAQSDRAIRRVSTRRWPNSAQRAYARRHCKSLRRSDAQCATSRAAPSANGRRPAAERPEPPRARNGAWRRTPWSKMRSCRFRLETSRARYDDSRVNESHRPHTCTYCGL